MVHPNSSESMPCPDSPEGEAVSTSFPSGTGAHGHREPAVLHSNIYNKRWFRYMLGSVMILVLLLNQGSRTMAIPVIGSQIDKAAPKGTFPRSAAEERLHFQDSQRRRASGLHGLGTPRKYSGGLISDPSMCDPSRRRSQGRIGPVRSIARMTNASTVGLRFSLAPTVPRSSQDWSLITATGRTV
jgi:hypothetical protein